MNASRPTPDSMPSAANASAHRGISRQLSRPGVSNLKWIQSVH